MLAIILWTIILERNLKETDVSFYLRGLDGWLDLETTLAHTEAYIGSLSARSDTEIARRS